MQEAEGRGCWHAGMRHAAAREHKPSRPTVFSHQGGLVGATHAAECWCSCCHAEGRASSSTKAMRKLKKN